MLSEIKEFHDRHDLTYEGAPRLLPEDVQQFRVDFLKEEVMEFEEAFEEKDLVGCFDALLDLAYVLLGTAYLMGLFPVWRQGFAAVHTANMRGKCRADDPRVAIDKTGLAPKARHPNDVVKLPEFIGPELKLQSLING